MYVRARFLAMLFGHLFVYMRQELIELLLDVNNAYLNINGRELKCKEKVSEDPV
jgi:hypothetical protein